MTTSRGAGIQGLKPCKRYIATHDSSGKSVYAESPDQLFYSVPNFGGMARSYSFGSIPANLTDDADIKAYRAEGGASSYRKRSIVPPTPGANLVVCDLAPGAAGHMHRTVSIDFSICVEGEIDHELDGGEKVRLYPGVRRLSDPGLCHLELIMRRTTLFSEERCIVGVTRPTSPQDFSPWRFRVCLLILPGRS